MIQYTYYKTKLCLQERVDFLFRIVLTAILAVYTVTNVYIVRMLARWLGLHGAAAFGWYALFALLASAYVLSAALSMPMFWSRLLYWIGGTYMAAYVFLLIAVPAAHLMLRGRANAMTAAVLLMGVVLYAGWGIYNAGHIRTTRYTVESSKIEPMTIALISDLHMGQIIGEKQVAKMVEAINAIDADIVCMAGDMFDSGPAIEHPEEIGKLFEQIQSRNGIYAVFGNHDGAFRGQEGQARTLLESWGVTVLEDEAVSLENMTVIGRKDRGQPRKTAAQLMEGIDHGRFSIMLDHQPYELDEGAAAGVDLMLSGHTHRGQIFLGRLVTDGMYKLDYGILQEGGFTSIVSSGAGTWGPRVRTGTVSEVVAIEIR